MYHDNSIKNNTNCKFECLIDKENKKLFDNIDFCNINTIPGQRNSNKKQWKTRSMTYWDAGYIHAMKWRWFPIVDRFVDVFSSRDSDSRIIKREVDSVAVWLKSKKVGHIMRDNPQHGLGILGDKTKN